MEMNILIGIVLGYGILYVLIFIGGNRVINIEKEFSLNTMPGMELAIDEELKKGIISQQEADKQREKLQYQSEKINNADRFHKILSIVFLFEIVVFACLILFYKTNLYILGTIILVWLGTFISLALNIGSISSIESC